MTLHVINTIIISDDPQLTLMLKQVLALTDYNVVFESDHLDNEMSSKWMIEPDLLIVVKDKIDRTVLTKLKTINQHYPLPIVVFTASDSNQLIDQVIDSGVSSFIVDGLYENRIISILKTAYVRFTHQQKLLKQLDDLKTSLADRKIIDRAKGLVMQQRQCTEDEAYKLLRTSAMKQNLRLAVLSQNIFEAAVLLNQ
jgi:response regulator NasT